jgi:hypothetical protein
MNNGNNGTWGALLTADDTYTLTNEYVTNVANYVVKDEQYLLNDVTNGDKYNVKELTGIANAKARTLIADDDTIIQATTNTVYYLVTVGKNRAGADEIKSISSWTGYANGPATLANDANAYVVTTASAGYEVAQVVVIEAGEAAPAPNLYFYYENSSSSKYNAVIAKDGDDGYVANVYEKLGLTADQRLNFVYDGNVIDGTEVPFSVSKKYDIDVATVTVAQDVRDYDYIRAVYGDEDETEVTFTTDSTPVYAVVANSNGTYSIKTVDTVKLDDQLIVVTNGYAPTDKNFAVLYVLDVTQSKGNLDTLVETINPTEDEEEVEEVVE